MEPAFWIESWNEGGTKTSFHRRDIHPFVISHLTPDFLRAKRVLVPLCGKTNDLVYLRQFAAHVVGVELVPTAISQFFEEQELPFMEPTPGVFVSGNLTLLNRDIFATSPEELGRFDLVYDRAALVALPMPMRLDYVRHLDTLITPNGQQFVITLDYTPTLPTPPFSITPAEVEEYYAARYHIDHVEADHQPNHRMVAKFGLESLIEHAFMLTHRR